MFVFRDPAFFDPSSPRTRFEEERDLVAEPEPVLLEIAGFFFGETGSVDTGSSAGSKRCPVVPSEPVFSNASVVAFAASDLRRTVPEAGLLGAFGVSADAVLVRRLLFSIVSSEFCDEARSADDVSFFLLKISLSLLPFYCFCQADRARQV